MKAAGFSGGPTAVFHACIVRARWTTKGDWHVGSLLDGIDVADKGKGSSGRASAASGGGGGTAKTIKLAVAVVCLLVGSALIAWNAGLFSGTGRDTVDPTIPPEVAAAPAQLRPTPQMPSTNIPSPRPSSVALPN